MSGRGILFTAFEPSGDALAAPVIARLRHARPDIPIWAFGGPKMKAAGADLIETTTEHAAMLAGAVAKIREHAARVGRVRAWLVEHPLAVHVPVDSPAANWPICKAVRRQHPRARIVHLAAPQLWAWAPWRIRKLRRLTDHVLCLLPFEPSWFEPRGVKTTFVGHPLYEQAPPGVATTKDSNSTRLALLPGSRRSEVLANGPTMLAAAAALRARHPALRVTVAAYDEETRGLLGRLDGIELAVGRADDVLGWAGVVLVVSGTAVLQTASHGKPLVAIYNVSRWSWNLIGRWLVTTRTFTLPNLIAMHQGWGRITPEFVPHFQAVDPVVEALDTLIRDGAARQRQAEAFENIRRLYAGKRFADESAAAILAACGD